MLLAYTYDDDCTWDQKLLLNVSGSESTGMVNSRVPRKYLELRKSRAGELDLLGEAVFSLTAGAVYQGRRRARVFSASCSEMTMTGLRALKGRDKPFPHNFLLLLVVFGGRRR